MNGLQFAMAISVTFAAMNADAQFFKCVAKDGRITYQATPCSTERVDVKRCERHRTGSDDHVECLAKEMCDKVGAVGTTRNQCMKMARDDVQKEMNPNRDALQADLRAKRDEEAAGRIRNKPADKSPPMWLFVKGSQWESDALAKTLDQYLNTQYLPNQSFVVKYNGIAYLVQTRKVNTGIPAVYEIISTTETQAKDLTPAVKAPIDCSGLMRYAEAKGHGFFEKALIVGQAQKSGDCKF